MPARGSTTDAVGTGVPTLRLNLTERDVAEYVTYPEGQGRPHRARLRARRADRREPRLVLRRVSAGADDDEPDVNATTAQNPAAGTYSVERKQQVQYVTGNVTGQLSDSLRGRVAFNNSWSAHRRACCRRSNGTDPAGHRTTRKTSTFPNYSVSGNMDWVASPKLFFGVRGGYYMSDQHDTNVTEEPQYHLDDHEQHRLAGCAGEPAACDRLHQHSVEHEGRPGPADARLLPGRRHRATASSAATTSSSSACRPIASATTCSAANAAATSCTILWNTPLSIGVPISAGTYGYYAVRSNGVDPTKRLHHRGEHPHDEHRAVHPGCLDDQQQADDQRRHPHRA